MSTYGDLPGVEAIVPALGAFTTTTTPSSAQIGVWLAEGHSFIGQAIAAAGYVIPTDTSIAVYPSLTALNNLYAAAYALRARSIEPVTGEGEALSEVYLKDFWARLKYLVGLDLTALGVLLRTTATLSRRRIRSFQMRKVDGYSGAYEGLTLEPDTVSE